MREGTRRHLENLNAATAWAVEKSVASGSERAVLIAIARRAVGCVAWCDPREIMKEVRMRGRAYYECLIPLEQLREIERLTKPSDNAKLRAFHFPKFCESSRTFCNLEKKPSAALWTVEKSYSPLLQSLGTECADLNTKNATECGAKLSVQKPTQLKLFPDILTPAQAKEVCEECRGTGWRTTDKGAVLCAHSQAKFAGRWSIAAPSADHDALVWREIKKALGALHAPEKFKLVG